MKAFIGRMPPVGVIVITLILHGCASTQEIMATDADPLEPYNRVMFTINDKADGYVLKPIAKSYVRYVPEYLRNRVDDFFTNLNNLNVMVNNILQFKLHDAVEDSGRFVANVFFGLGGLYDVASFMKIPQNDEDFGQTLGYWGVGEGYYLVLPLLGPSTTRDVWKLPVDSMTDLFDTGIVSFFGWEPLGNLGYSPLSDLGREVTIPEKTLQIINLRANLLPLEKAFGASQIDSYSFQRQAYLQARRNAVYDGNPPQPEMNIDQLLDN